MSVDGKSCDNQYPESIACKTKEANHINGIAIQIQGSHFLSTMILTNFNTELFQNHHFCIHYYDPHENGKNSSKLAFPVQKMRESSGLNNDDNKSTKRVAQMFCNRRELMRHSLWFSYINQALTVHRCSLLTNQVKHFLVHWKPNKTHHQKGVFWHKQLTDECSAQGAVTKVATISCLLHSPDSPPTVFELTTWWLNKHIAKWCSWYQNLNIISLII